MKALSSAWLGPGYVLALLLFSAQNMLGFLTLFTCLAL